MALRLWSRRDLSPRSRLWLAAVDGVARWPSREPVSPIDGPEAPLEVEFEGLTDEEQRRALAAFPGGRRFVLKAGKIGR
ncbi:MAG TPA: hypothetical protein GYA10_14005 [Alphaproteobacteria bacterium]|nr:hypothetical protein [Alphaproteobacteria bacterium]